MSKLVREYKITDAEGKVSVVNSLNAFASKVGIYYGQFYTALHKGSKTKKGGYKVEWYKDTESEVIKSEVKPTNPKSKVVPLGKDVNIINAGKLEVLDILQEGNTHKVKVKTSEGKVATRKINFRRTGNMNGTKCDFSEHLIPKGALYAEVQVDKTYKLSVDQLTKLGYDLKIDFDFNTKIVEKKVEIFTPTLLEQTWLVKQEAVMKEITKTQTKLAKLRDLKDYIGRNVSSVKQVNEDLSKVDGWMKKLF